MLAHLASFLLGLATAFVARVVQHAVQQRRARAVVNALIAEARAMDDRPTPLDWSVHHVDCGPLGLVESRMGDDPSIEARAERCLMLLRDGRFVEAETTFECDGYDEIIDRVPFVSAGGDG